MPTIIDVLLEANPESLEVMRQRVQALAKKEGSGEDGASSFLRLKAIPRLHFMSMQIFEDGHFDPLFVFENNFDGDPDTYWDGVLAQLSEDLRNILACTKAAKDATWKTLFNNGSRASLKPFLLAHSCSPSAQHFGAVANPLTRIQRDRGVFEDLQEELGPLAEGYRGCSAGAIHPKLQQWAMARYPWMQLPENPSTSKAIATYRWSPIPPVLPAALAVLAGGATAISLCISNVLPQRGFAGARSALRAVVGGTAVALGLLGVAFWKTVRHLENTDMVQDDPELSPVHLKAFANQEDQIVQNHLASMVLVKPGAVRAILIRVSLGLLKFGVPLVAWNGYLGAMRTIHFAHWTLVGNSGRLLFLSNFDGSWQSYLDDFVDKAAGGLTLAWGNCVGFPRTTNLVQGGAAHGTQFKAWARQSQTQSLLWYSAYAELTVNQIIRNAAIVDGLRKSRMQEPEAEEWAQLL